VEACVLIGRLLSFNYSMGNVGGGSGMKSPGNLLKIEHAGLLSGLNEVETAYAFAKYGLDDHSRRKLVGYVLSKSFALADKEGWKCEVGFLKLLSDLAVAEAVDSHICMKCHGTGCEGIKPCKSCKGTGRKAVSDRQKAKAVGIDVAAWCRTWRRRYNEILSFVNEIDGSMQYHFQNKRTQ